MDSNMQNAVFLVKQSQFQQLEKELNKYYYPIVSTIFKNVALCYSNIRTTEKEAEICTQKWYDLQQQLTKQEHNARLQCKHIKKIKQCSKQNEKVIECIQKRFDLQTKCLINNYTKVYKQYSKLVYT